MGSRLLRVRREQLVEDDREVATPRANGAIDALAIAAGATDAGFADALDGERFEAERS